MLALLVVLVIAAMTWMFHDGQQRQTARIYEAIVQRTPDPEAGKPYQRVAWAKKVFLCAMQQIDDMKDKGYLTDATYEAMKPIKRDLGKAIDGAERGVRIKNDDAVNEQLKVAHDKLNDLLLMAQISPEALPPFSPTTKDK